MNNIKGAAHHDICSKRLNSIVVGAAHHDICSNRLWKVVAGAHRNLKLRCAAPYAALFVLGYKYCAALPLNDWKIIFSPLNTEGV